MRRRRLSSADTRLLKLATFNINGVNQRLGNLLGWLEEAQPDVVCLQEIKCFDAAFPIAQVEGAGYHAVWAGQGPHHGVAILAKGSQPIETRHELPGDPGDREARYIEAAVRGVLVGCLYLPNGNPQPGPKFDYKLAWFERFIAHAADLRAAGVPAVLAGDFNVVPTDADIYSMRSWTKNALVQPAPRAAYRRLLDQGWADALAELHPHETVYTFWAYLRDSWTRNAGLRLDHLLLAPSLIDRLTDGGVDSQERSKPGASDHAPAWIELAIETR